MKQLRNWIQSPIWEQITTFMQGTLLENHKTETINNECDTAKKLSQIIYYCNKNTEFTVLLILNYTFSCTLHSSFMQIRAICAYKIYQYLMHMENASQAWSVKTAQRVTTVHWKPMIGHAKQQVLWYTINWRVLLDPW